LNEQTTEAAVAAAAQKVSAVGGGAALVGGLTANEVAAFGGLFVAIVGALIQWYYEHKADKRSHRLYEKRMAAIDAGEDEDDDEG